MTERIAYRKWEVALRLGCSIDTVERRIRDGTLIAHKCGDMTLIKHADLEAFMAAWAPMSVPTARSAVRGGSERHGAVSAGGKRKEKQ